MRADPVRRAVQLTREEVVRRGNARIAELEAELLAAQYASARALTVPALACARCGYCTPESEAVEDHCSKCCDLGQPF